MHNPQWREALCLWAAEVASCNARSYLRAAHVIFYQRHVVYDGGGTLHVSTHNLEVN